MPARRWPIRPARWVAALLALASAASVASDDAPNCRTLDLPVQVVTAPPLAYRLFCARLQVECEMSGPNRLADDPATRALVARVNRQVNAQIRFMSDLDSVGVEEDWRYPVRGYGDCEDIALEKRRRLVSQGLPRAALTMAIVHHQNRASSHAVLLAETLGGTFVLDNLSDAITCWDQAGFNYETRERADGQWDQFDQRVWIQGVTTSGPPGACP
jgi:predicted transglutaminase-like cysteine proteinase